MNPWLNRVAIVDDCDSTSNKRIWDNCTAFYYLLKRKHQASDPIERWWVDLRQFLQGIDQGEHVGLDSLSVANDLFLRVQDLNALRVGIVTDREGAIHRVGELTNSHLRILEGLGHKVHWLILCDWILLLCNLGRLEGSDLGLVTQAVFELTKRGKQTSTISTDLIPLTTDTKLNREPVDRCKPFNVLIRCTKRGKTNLLGKVCEIWVGKQGNMAEQFMADIGFRGVQGLGVMTDILGRVEDTESEAIQEITTSQKTHDGAQRKASAILQEPGDIIQLRDLLGAVTAVLDQQGEDVLVLAASMGREHACQLVEDRSPGVDLNLRVVDARDALTTEHKSQRKVID